MNKTLMLTMLALAMGGIAMTAVPNASAWYCVGYGEPGATIADACNFAAEEARDVAGFAVTEAGDVVQVALEHLP